MPIFPLHTATDGLIRTVVPKIDSLVIGTRGLLWDYQATPTPTPDPLPPNLGGGGGQGKGKGKGKGRTYKNYKEQKNQDLKFEFLKQEDEEIMAIIKTFMKCQ